MHCRLGSYVYHREGRFAGKFFCIPHSTETALEKYKYKKKIDEIQVSSTSTSTSTSASASTSTSKRNTSTRRRSTKSRRPSRSGRTRGRARRRTREASTVLQLRAIGTGERFFLFKSYLSSNIVITDNCSGCSSPREDLWIGAPPPSG